MDIPYEDKNIYTCNKLVGLYWYDGVYIEILNMETLYIATIYAFISGVNRVDHFLNVHIIFFFKLLFTYCLIPRIFFNVNLINIYKRY